MQHIGLDSYSGDIIIQEPSLAKSVSHRIQYQ